MRRERLTSRAAERMVQAEADRDQTAELEAAQVWVRQEFRLGLEARIPALELSLKGIPQTRQGRVRMRRSSQQQR